jgi:Outer membrane protein/protective antigen OMA87
MWGTIIVAGLLLAPPDGVSESAALQPAAQQTETVASIQVQGNTATPDEEVRRMADVRVGMPFDAATVDAVSGRLRATKRFDSVEVRKRFASIEDPSQIALVIIVDEGPVKIVMTGDPDSPTRVARKRLPNMLILPILNREDGYGITYGARLTLPDPQWLGKRSRVTFPLTWGGTKQGRGGHREASRRRSDRSRDGERLDLAQREPGLQPG